MVAHARGERKKPWKKGEGFQVNWEKINRKKTKGGRNLREKGFLQEMQGPASQRSGVKPRNGSRKRRGKQH